MTDPQRLPIAEIYIDESSQTNHRFLVLGGIIAEIDHSPIASDAIRRARLPELPDRNMKWVKVSRTKLPAYTRAVDCFFDSTPNETLDFHSLTVDTFKQRHDIYNQGSKEVGFNKEIYQLAMKFGRLYAAKFHIYPDRRTTNQSTDDLRLMLNRGLMKKDPNADWPYRRVQFREPEDSQLLQMADVFSGAVAWSLNGHARKPNASPAKTELAQYILDRAGVADVTRSTAMSGKFTIWHRRLRG